MRAVRRERQIAFEQRMALAWHTAAFTARTQSQGGLKPLREYLVPDSRQNSGDIIAALKTWKAAGAPIAVRRLPRERLN